MDISYRLHVLTTNEDPDTGKHKRPSNHGVLVFSDKAKWDAMASLLRESGADVHQSIRMYHNGSVINFNDDSLHEVRETLRNMLRAVDKVLYPSTNAKLAAAQAAE
jgi:hypothetical protein